MKAENVIKNPLYSPVIFGLKLKFGEIIQTKLEIAGNVSLIYVLSISKTPLTKLLSILQK